MGIAIRLNLGCDLAMVRKTSEQRGGVREASLKSCLQLKRSLRAFQLIVRVQSRQGNVWQRDTPVQRKQRQQKVNTGLLKPPNKRLLE
jgi:hypothetical protein